VERTFEELKILLQPEREAFLFKVGPLEAGLPVDYISPNVHQLGLDQEFLIKNGISLFTLMTREEIPALTKKIKETYEISHHFFLNGEPMELLARATRDESGNAIYFSGAFFPTRRESPPDTEVLAKRLEMANQRLEEFVYVVSHDLQSPCSQISAYVDLISESIEKEPCDKEMVKDFVEKVKKTTNWINTLITDLLVYSKVNIGSEYSKVPVDLDEVLKDVSEDFGAKVEKVGARLIIQDFPVIYGNYTQLRQLFQNLIGNALKFRSPDRPVVVKVSNEIKDDRFTITIEDNGIGFDEKFNESIFMIFKRLHSSERYLGTGVGLAICRNIVERHDGTIEAFGHLGLGSKFTISFPAEIINETGV
jgi:signal transduction histidine kinase